MKRQLHTTAAILVLLLVGCKSQPGNPTIISNPLKDSIHSELDISLDSAIATGIEKQSSRDSDNGMWQDLPEFAVYTLKGYPDTSLEPWIFVFRTSDVEETSAHSAQNVANLRQLLQDKPDMGVYPVAGVDEPRYYVPWLLPINARPVTHSKVEYLDFQDGTGMRYLTQYNQAVTLLNNEQLCYTFQGLTRDGEYYIAAVFPVSYPDLLARPDDLPAGEDLSIVTDTTRFFQYMQEVVQMLDKAESSSFIPDLATLDAAIRSLSIQ